MYIYANINVYIYIHICMYIYKYTYICIDIIHMYPYLSICRYASVQPLNYIHILVWSCLHVYVAQRCKYHDMTSTDTKTSGYQWMDWGRDWARVQGAVAPTLYDVVLRMWEPSHLLSPFIKSIGQSDFDSTWKAAERWYANQVLKWRLTLPYFTRIHSMSPYVTCEADCGELMVLLVSASLSLAFSLHSFLDSSVII